MSSAPVALMAASTASGATNGGKTEVGKLPYSEGQCSINTVMDSTIRFSSIDFLSKFPGTDAFKTNLAGL